MASSSSSSTRAPKSSSTTTTSPYLFLYNAGSLALWSSLTIRLVLLLIPRLLATATTGQSNENENENNLFSTLFSPHLLYTQSLAGLEILHSLFGLVRAPVITTAMQVASRLLVVWGILWMFASEEGFGGGEGVIRGSGGELAFVGCLVAWGITECIRYGFFALQVSGFGMPAWLTWLRFVFFFFFFFYFQVHFEGVSDADFEV